MQLVFESTYHLPDNIKYLYYIHIFLLFVVASIGFIFRKKLSEYRGLVVFFIICSFFYYLELESKIGLSKDIHYALNNKTYKVVSGKIENFKAMHPSGHELETFEVKGISFATSYGNTKLDNTFFFNLTKAYGSPIQKNGQIVKIFYLPSKISNFCIPLIPECLEFKEERGIIKLWLVE